MQGMIPSVGQVRPAWTLVRLGSVFYLGKRNKTRQLCHPTCQRDEFCSIHLYYTLDLSASHWSRNPFLDDHAHPHSNRTSI